MLEGLALRVDRIDDALFQRRLERTEGQVVLVVTLEPQLGRVLHRLQHLGVVVPVVRIRKLHDLHVLHRHVVEPEHQLDALVLLDPPPVVLDGVQALREADLLALQILHPVDVVPGAHHHAAALVRRVRHAEEPGPADVRVDGDGREQPAEADQVVEVVDVVRVPVVLLDRAHELVLHADLLELLPGPPQFLVDVAGRHEGTVGVVHLLPIQRDRVEFRRWLGHGCLGRGCPGGCCRRHCFLLMVTYRRIGDVSRNRSSPIHDGVWRGSPRRRRVNGSRE